MQIIHGNQKKTLLMRRTPWEITGAEWSNSIGEKPALKEVPAMSGLLWSLESDFSP